MRLGWMSLMCSYALPLKLGALVLVACATLGACNSAAVDDEISLSVAKTPAHITLGCADDCPMSTVVLDLEFEGGYRPSEDQVELLQYRVDYDIPDLRAKVPFFAAETAITLRPGGRVQISLPLVGRKQRSALTSGVTQLPMEGLVTLTLAGYDPQNENLTLSVDIPVRLVAPPRKDN